MEMINYKGIDYPAMEVYFERLKMYYFISTESLADAISPDGTFDDLNGEAERIDQRLYFYIPDELMMSTGSRRKIMNYLNSQT